MRSVLTGKRIETPLDKLRTIRELWRGDRDSLGYAHPALVIAACRLLDPHPNHWGSKDLWLVFYTEKELEEGVPIEAKWTIEKGFELYSLFEQESKIGD